MWWVLLSVLRGLRTDTKGRDPEKATWKGRQALECAAISRGTPRTAGGHWKPGRGKGASVSRAHRGP